MTEQAKETLRSSIEEHGFKTIIAVHPVGDGTFEVIDGHHRWEQANQLGMDEVPVVLMQDTEDGLDLAMLSFNVTAEVIPGVYLDFLRELDLRVGSETLAKAAALDKDFLDDLGATLTSATIDDDLGLDGDSGSDRTRGGAINLLLPRTPEVRSMLNDVRSAYGLDTDADAVVFALKYTTSGGFADGNDEGD